MSLHARLVAAVTVLSVVLLGVALTVVWLSVRSSQQEQLDADLRSEAIEEAHEVATNAGGELTLDRDTSPADDSSTVSKYAVVYGADGAPLAWTTNLEGRVPVLAGLRAPRATCFDFHVGHEHVRGILVDVPRRSGSVLLVAASSMDLDADVSYLRRALLLAFAVVVMLTAVIAARIVRRFTRDYEAIAEVTRRVAEGDLTARVAPILGDKEIARLQVNINAMIEQLESLLTSHQRFVAHAAHELRSPLATLYGELSLALRRTRTNEEYRFTIEQALDATRRLNLLAEDLLALARLDAGSDESWHDLGLSEIMANAGQSVSLDLRSRRVDLRLEPTNLRVRTRGTELERMLRNLIENAVRHSPEGGEVRVRIASSEGTVILIVEDQGAGIPEAERARVFEPFWRGAEQQASGAPGAGLGLAIAQQIARAHGGRVDLDAPHERGGTAFRITLPVSSEAVSDLTTEAKVRTLPLATKTMTNS